MELSVKSLIKMNNCTVNTIKVLPSPSLRSNVLEAVAPLSVLSSKVGEVIKSTFLFPHVPLVGAFCSPLLFTNPFQKKKNYFVIRSCVFVPGFSRTCGRTGKPRTPRGRISRAKGESRTSSVGLKMGM